MKLIPSIKKLFWEVNQDKLDTNKNKKSIIVRTLNYGTINDWKFLKQNYGSKTIIEILNSNRSGVREKTEKLARLIFN